MVYNTHAKYLIFWNICVIHLRIYQAILNEQKIMDNKNQDENI